jgi:hypothetical protein
MLSIADCSSEQDPATAAYFAPHPLPQPLHLTHRVCPCLIHEANEAADLSMCTHLKGGNKNGGIRTGERPTPVIGTRLLTQQDASFCLGTKLTNGFSRVVAMTVDAQATTMSPPLNR